MKLRQLQSCDVILSVGSDVWFERGSGELKEGVSEDEQVSLSTANPLRVGGVLSSSSVSLCVLSLLLMAAGISFLSGGSPLSTVMSRLAASANDTFSSSPSIIAFRPFEDVVESEWMKLLMERWSGWDMTSCMHC